MAVMAIAMNHFNMDGEYFDDDEEVENEEEDETLYFFGGLFRRDANERVIFLENLSKCAKTWVTKSDDFCAKGLLKAHLPTVLRLSINSPYKEIREQLSKLLVELKVSV